MHESPPSPHMPWPPQPSPAPKSTPFYFLTPNAKGCCWVLRTGAPRHCHPRGWPTPPEAALAPSPTPDLNIKKCSLQTASSCRGSSRERAAGGSLGALTQEPRWPGGVRAVQPPPRILLPQVGGHKTGGAIPVLDVQGEGRLCQMDFGALGSRVHG